MTREQYQQAHQMMLAWSAPILGASIVGYILVTVGVPLALSLAYCVIRRIRGRRKCA